MSVVYFVRRADGTGPIKIGCSAYLENRVKSLCYTTQQELVVLATAPGSFREEGRLHRQFADARVDGEWFEPNAELMAAIAFVTANNRLPPVSEEDREVAMARRYLSGETLQEIADDFDVTRERVRQLLRKSGVPSLGFRARHRRKPLPVSGLEREIAEIYAAGNTKPADIFAKYQINQAQLAAILRRTETPTFSTSYWLKRDDDAERVERVKALYQQGVKTAEIAETVGLGHQTHVYYYLRKAGIKPQRHGRASLPEDQIIADYHGGETMVEIASKLGVAQHAIKYVIDRRGARLPRHITEQRRIAAVRAANHRRARLAEANAA